MVILFLSGVSFHGKSARTRRLYVKISFQKCMKENCLISLFSAWIHLAKQK